MSNYSDDGYLKVTLLVKDGEGARQKVGRVLNEWYTEGGHDAPFEPGTLLYYSIHDRAPAPPDGTDACTCTDPDCPDPVHQFPAEPEEVQA